MSSLSQTRQNTTTRLASSPSMKKSWKPATLDASSLIASVKHDQQKLIESCVEDQVNLDEFELKPSVDNRGMFTLQYRAVSCDVYAEDVEDALLIAIMKSMMIMGNIPLTPKEICKCITHYKLATLTGSAPHSIVSSRISHHFKRVAEHSDRRPLFGKMLTVAPPSSPSMNRIKDLILSAGERGEKKMRYYLNQLKTRMVSSSANPLLNRPSHRSKAKKVKSDASSQSPFMDPSKLPTDVITEATLASSAFSPYALLGAQGNLGLLPNLPIAPPTPESFPSAFLSAALSPAAALLFANPTPSSNFIPTPSPSPVPQCGKESIIEKTASDGETRDEDTGSEYSGDENIKVKPRRSKPRGAKRQVSCSPKKKRTRAGSTSVSEASGEDQDSEKEPGLKRRKRSAAIAAASAIRNDVMKKGRPSPDEQKLNSPSQSRTTQRSPQTSTKNKSLKTQDSHNSRPSVPLIITDPADYSPAAPLANRKRSDSVRSLDTNMFNGDAGNHFFNFEPEDVKSPVDGKGFLKIKSYGESVEDTEDLPLHLDATLELISSKNPKAPSDIWMTMIDGAPLMIMYVGQQGHRDQQKSTHLQVPDSDSSDKVPLLRRLDDGMVNASLLLHAGGVKTERERSVVLSLEPQRIRYKDSRLRGAWVPLSRAQEMATSLYMGTKVSLFLSDQLGSVLFGIEQVQRRYKGKRKSKNLMSQFEHVLENNSPAVLPLFPLVPPASKPIKSTDAHHKNASKNSSASHLALQQQIAHNFFSQNPLAAQAFLSMLAGGLDVSKQPSKPTQSATSKSKSGSLETQNDLNRKKPTAPNVAATIPYSIASPIFTPFPNLMATTTAAGPSTKTSHKDSSLFVNPILPQPFMWPPLSLPEAQPIKANRRWKKGGKWVEPKRAMIRDGDPVNEFEFASSSSLTANTLSSTSDAYTTPVQSVCEAQEPPKEEKSEALEDIELVMDLFGDSSEGERVIETEDSDDSTDSSDDEMNLDAAVRLGASMLASLERNLTDDDVSQPEEPMWPQGRRTSKRKTFPKKVRVPSPPTPPPPPMKRHLAKKSKSSRQKIPNKNMTHESIKREVESDFEIDIIGDDGMDDLR